MSPFARAATAVLAAPLAYSLLEPYRIVVRRFTLTIECLPCAVEGLTIAQLSDLHCSAITPPGLVRRAVALCNAQNPDAIVLTGDYVSRRSSYAPVTFARSWARPVMEYAAAVAAELSQLEAPAGVFAVPGNHDHSRQRFDAIGQLLQEAGITALVNRSVCIRDALPIIGLDDLRGGRPRLRQACTDISPDQAQLILSHNPRLLWLLGDRHCFVLSGHTHGGQVRLPFNSFRVRPKDMNGTAWYQGWYQHGRAHMYVSTGVGSVHFPMRFRCPPEIALFTLRAT